MAEIVTSPKRTFDARGVFSALRHFLFPLILPALDAAWKVAEVTILNKQNVQWDSVYFAFYAALVAGIGRMFHRYMSEFKVETPA